MGGTEAQPGTFGGAFARPVRDAQSVFRRLMNAMAKPGTVETVPPLAQPPGGLSPATGAVALTLFDADTPIWLDEPLAGDELVAHWIRFHTGATQTSSPAEAQFAVIAHPQTFTGWHDFSAGTHHYPDQSATLIMQLPSLTDGPSLTVSGPGIRGTRSIAPRGLPDRFVEHWAANHALFPRGLDLILTAADAVTALPRSTRIEPEGR